jgi:hypothetical protein
MTIAQACTRLSNLLSSRPPVRVRRVFSNDCCKRLVWLHSTPASHRLFYFQAFSGAYFSGDVASLHGRRQSAAVERVASWARSWKDLGPGFAAALDALLTFICDNLAEGRTFGDLTNVHVRVARCRQCYEAHTPAAHSSEFVIHESFVARKDLHQTMSKSARHLFVHDEFA